MITLRIDAIIPVGIRSEAAEAAPQFINDNARLPAALNFCNQLHSTALQPPLRLARPFTAATRARSPERGNKTKDLDRFPVCAFCNVSLKVVAQ
jgi:hypothetical protein